MTGLDYADQRYYQPGMGRFLTADPYRASAGAEDPGSWNRTAYVQGDPVNFNDPLGLMICFVNASTGKVDQCWTPPSSVTVRATRILISSIPGYSDQPLAYWHDEQNERENNCTTAAGRNCWEVDRQRREIEKNVRDLADCGMGAVKKNGVSLTLDLASALISSAGATVAGVKLALGLTSTVASASSGPEGAAAATASIVALQLDAYNEYSRLSSTPGVMAIANIGKSLSYLAIANDLWEIWEDTQNCMKKK